MSEGMSERQWQTLRRIAWSPEFEPPKGTPEWERHELFRQAVDEANRLRGYSRGSWDTNRSLMEVLGRHRVMAPVEPGQTEPKLWRDLFEWAAVTVERETYQLREERDQARAELAAMREEHPDEWGVGVAIVDNMIDVSSFTDGEAAARRAVANDPDSRLLMYRRGPGQWREVEGDGDA